MEIMQKTIYNGGCPLCGARLYVESNGEGRGTLACEQQHYRCAVENFEAAWEGYKNYSEEVDAINRLYHTLIEINEVEHGPFNPDDILERKE